MQDMIAEEVRVAREAHAAKFNYDLAAIFQDLKNQETQSKWPTASLPPKKPAQAVKKAG